VDKIEKRQAGKETKRLGVFSYGSCGRFSGICLEVQMDVINYAHPDTRSKFSIDNSFPKGLF
jgi:hypothetical protein